MNKISLPKGYHNFADKRKLVGLPNAMNVLSNLFIIIPVIYLLKHKTENNTNNNLLIIHITLLSLASAYYHYNLQINPSLGYSNDSYFIYNSIKYY